MSLLLGKSWCLWFFLRKPHSAFRKQIYFCSFLSELHLIQIFCPGNISEDLLKLPWLACCFSRGTLWMCGSCVMNQHACVLFSSAATRICFQTVKQLPKEAVFSWLLNKTTRQILFKKSIKSCFMSLYLSLTRLKNLKYNIFIPLYVLSSFSFSFQKVFILCHNNLVTKLLGRVCNVSYPNSTTFYSQFHLQPLSPCLFLCFHSLRLTALPQVERVSRVTVTRLAPSHLTAMKPVSAGASRASPDQNVTAAREGSSTSRRAAAHVSLDTGAEKRVFSWYQPTEQNCSSINRKSWLNQGM